MSLPDISKFLTTHNGRDKFVRTLCYSTRLISTLISSERYADSLNKISSELSSVRTTLRLFDDIPMLNYTLTYGFGKQEEDKVVRLLNVLTNAIDQTYYPIEHIAWAADHKLLTLDSNPWWVATSWCWVISLYLGLIKYVRTLAILQRHKSCLNVVDCDISVALAPLRAQQKKEFLAMTRCIIDLVHAVHTLPEGFLWSGKLTRWQVALVGTISSLLGLYMAFPGKTKTS
uniref:Peroxisomal membrane protein 11C n=2 Tax=Timema TaxID=61471 RepID=A0A7R9H5S1_TIMPO|nr:unnamed protein product [Timema douglasi]CAD7410260.1 unnamed protein product [Timema poppensis]